MTQQSKLTKKNQNKRERNLSTFVSITNAFLFLILFFPNYSIYWGILFLSANFFFLINGKKKFRLYFTDLMWFLFIIVQVFGMLSIKSNKIEAIQFIIVLCMLFITKVLLSSSEKWISKYLKGLTLITSFFIIGSLLNLVFPSIVKNINELHFDSSKLFMIEDLAYNTGFLYQTAANGFVISIFMALVLSLLITLKSKKYHFLLSFIYLASYFLLFTTGKRGFILFNAIAFMIILLLCSKLKIKGVLYIIVFGFVSSLFLFNTEIGMSILNRFTDSSDITTGRTDLVLEMWKDFKNKPVLGNGTFSTIERFTSVYNGHNIYMQILRENGVFGFLLFITILISNLFKSFKIIYFSSNQIRGVVFSFYSQLLFILWGFTGNPLYDTYPLIIYMISEAVIYVSLKSTDIEENSELLYSQ